MDPYRVELMKVIDENDGKFSWYQLDRMMVTRQPSNESRPRNIVAELRELMAAGLVRSVSGHNSSQPLYSLTKEGQEVIAHREST